MSPLQLKQYQEEAVRQIKKYVTEARRLQNADIAFYAVTKRAYAPLPNNLAAVPYICIQIPTGGGKTLVASYSVREVFTHYLEREVELVLWVVPWESILSQTLAALSSAGHPYRQVLDTAFPKGVRIFRLKEALSGSLSPSDLADNLCVIVCTIDAFRKEVREGRKVYEANGKLMAHFEHIDPAIEPLLNREPEAGGSVIPSLENVIRQHNPLVILDEGHNAQTGLSFETLGRLNPAFILEYTATPRGHSNVLVNIPAVQLKQEEMVKLPLWLYVRASWKATLQAAQEQRDRLEQDALAEQQATGEYIRPILLIQAEPKSQDDPDRVTVKEVRDFLLHELSIPPDQVAVKTGDRDDLKGKNLLGHTSVRYIITVYALKEGWDCSFAYVLASVASMGDRLAVQQLIGRVLRLPGAKRKQVESLNYAYVYSCAPRFSTAAQAVHDALLGNGYAPDDVREPPAGGQPSLSVGRAVQDPAAVVPKLAYQETGTWEELQWDHLFVGFKLPQCDPTIVFNPPDEELSAKFDVEPDKVVIQQQKPQPHQLPLLFPIREVFLDTNGLVTWLDKRVRDVHISQRDNQAYCRQVIAYLIAQHGQEYLAELTRHRFHLQEVLKERISHHIDAHTHNQLLGYKGAGKIAASGQVPYDLPASIILERPHKDTFQRHLYVQAATMNAEEAALATRLDALENLLWWYRNRENQDFYLQGWWGRFYPDFVAKTKNGLLLVLEYKGSQLAGGPDAQRKAELGQIWEEVSGGQGRFWMVEASNMNAVIAEIKGL